MSKIKNKNIVFLIRAYNEGTRIRSVIAGIFVRGFDQIVVVDDGSTDDTHIILREMIASGQIHYLRHTINRGAGAALETGFEYIRRGARRHDWQYVVTFDADGQHDIADIDHFIAAFEADPDLDVVLGSRFIEKTSSNVPTLRRATLWGGKIFTSMISGISLTDAHNGYRMFRIKTIDAIHLTMDGMEYASELIDEIQAGGYRIQEVPVNIHYDDYTMAKGQRYGGVTRIVSRMLMKKFF